MRVLTYNTWHGLTGAGLLSFGELEPASRRRLRFQLQDRELSDSGADLLFLQELNPVGERAKRLARQLAKDEVHQVDQAGMKLFGYGVPSNLSSGLAILARQGWGLKHLASVRLSGGFGRSGDLFNVQLAEVRYALIAAIKHPMWGDVLLCNAHLHHGFELTPSLEKKLEDGLARGVISREERARMETVMMASRERRIREVERLFQVLEPLAKGRDGVLMGGDLNSTPQGIAYRMVMERGFVDLHAEALKARGLTEENTWDPPRNRANHELAENFVYTVPSFGRSEVKALLRAYDLESRRIDFLFARGSVAEGQITCRLWAQEPRNGLILSDHFGVLADWRE